MFLKSRSRTKMTYRCSKLNAYCLVAEIIQRWFFASADQVPSFSAISITMIVQVKRLSSFRRSCDLEWRSSWSPICRSHTHTHSQTTQGTLGPIWSVLSLYQISCLCYKEVFAVGWCRFLKHIFRKQVLNGTLTTKLLSKLDICIAN